MRKVTFVALSWALVSLAGITAAVATPASGKIDRNELVSGKITDTIDLKREDPSDLHLQDVTFDPGSDTGWHTHPGAEIAVVKAGELILERPGCKAVTLAAGQGAFIPAGTPHRAHNGSAEPAEIYSTQIAPAGTTVLREDAEDACPPKK